MAAGLIIPGYPIPKLGANVGLALTLDAIVSATAALTRDLKGTGIWDTQDIIAPLCTTTEIASLTDLKTPARVFSKVGTPIFTPNLGWTFDGTNALSTNYTPATDKVNLSPTSCMIAAYESANVGSTTFVGGIGTSTNQFSLCPRTSGNAMRAALHATVTSGTTVTNIDSRGLSAGDRSGSSFNLYKAGALYDTITPTNQNGVLGTVPIYIGAVNNGGVLTNGRPTTLAFFMVGASLSAAQHAALAIIIENYLSATQNTAMYTTMGGAVL